MEPFEEPAAGACGDKLALALRSGAVSNAEAFSSALRCVEASSDSEGEQEQALHTLLRALATSGGSVTLPEALSRLLGVGASPDGPALARSLTGTRLPAMLQRLLSPLSSGFAELSALGRGGFGSVFSALSLMDNRRVALKRIPFRCPCPPWAPRHALADAAAPLLREVRALAALNHPHVVAYHTAWVEPRWGRLAQELLVSGAAATPTAVGRAAPGWPAPLLLLEEGAAAQLPRGGLRLRVADRAGRSGSSDEDQHDELSSSRSDHSDGDPSTQATVAVGERALCSARSSHRSSHHWPYHLFISMELLPGRTLAAWMANRPVEGAAQQACAFVSQVAQGLAHLHARGVMHRDLKPGNIVLTDRGRGKPPRAIIVDLGLAAFTSAQGDVVAEPHGRSSHSGEHTQGVGTATYAAPEQSGSSGGFGYGPAADVFSLGLILIEALSPPFRTAMERAHTLHAARQGCVPSHVEVAAAGCGALAEQMLHAEPACRPSAAAVARAAALRGGTGARGGEEELRRRLRERERQVTELKVQLLTLERHSDAAS